MDSLIITEEYINDTSGNSFKESRLEILNNYINAYGKNPTEEEYNEYKVLWYNGRKAKVKCDYCGCIVTNGGLIKHHNTKKCKAARHDLED